MSGLTRLKGAFLVAVEHVMPDPTQPRRTFEEAKLRELADSIRERGIQQPIRVRFDVSSGKQLIVYGERRYRAALLAGLTEVPCIIADAASLDEETILIDQIAENWQRADLEPVELSNALVRLRDKHQLKQEEIARRLGKSKGEISKLLSIQRVQVDIREEARNDNSGRFSRRSLVAIAPLKPEEQRLMVEKMRSGMPASEVERAAARLKRQGRGERVTRTTGTTRRFVVGNATIEVRYRKRDVTNEEVVQTLERAAAMAKEG